MPERVNKMATIYSFPTGFDGSEHDYFTNVVEMLERDYPEHFKQIKRGDLFENQSNNQYTYRSFGLSIFDIIDNKLVLVPLSDEPDDYGTIPSQFKVITQFPIDHWHREGKKVIDILNTGEADCSYFHNEFVPVDTSIFEEISDGHFKCVFDNKIYIINTEFSPFDDGYTCVEDISVYPIDHVFSENDFKLPESESETEETSIELQIKMLDLEIEAKMKLREYLQSKLK